MKWVVVVCAIVTTAAAVFTYNAVNTLCDDDYWPDW